MPSHTHLTASSVQPNSSPTAIKPTTDVRVGRIAYFVTLAVCGCAVDLWTKSVTFAWLGSPLETTDNTWWLFEPYVGVQTSLNPGALFGLGQGYSHLFAALSVLAGIAIGAFAGAATGVLIYIADDAQLRDLTFWGLGSLAGATWTKIAATAPIILIAFAASPFLARGLNALALGESAAHHMGISVQRMKNITIVVVAAATGASVAAAGAIGFVGIVVPHLLRLAIFTTCSPGGARPAVLRGPRPIPASSKRRRGARPPPRS